MKYNNVKMVEHIRKYNPICPVCENAEWVLDQVVADVIYHNTNLSQAAARVICTCATCGNTLLFDPYVAGVIEDEDEE